MWIISAPLSKDSSLEGIYSQKRGCSGTQWGISYFGHSKPNWFVGGLYPASGEGSALLRVLLHTSKPWLWSQVEQRETQVRAEMSSVRSQGNGPPGTAAHEIDYFGQGGYKMSHIWEHPSVLQEHSTCVEGQHHTLTGQKIFLATGRPDLMLLLSLGASLVLSFPYSSSDHRVQPKAPPGWFLFS